MKDILVKAIACNGKVRIYTCTTTNLVEEARLQHDMWPTSTAALGRVLSVGVMMGSMLKSEKEKLTIQINGGGPLGTIMVDAYSDGNVRGFVGDPHQMLTYNDTGKLAVGLVVGNNGTLKVIKDLSLKNDFTGTVALQTGEIGDDFAYYFTVSEQTPSAVSVGVLVDTDNHVIASGGIIIQMMPDASDDDISVVEKVIQAIKPVSNLVQSGMDAKEIALSLFDDIEIVEQRDCALHCDCGHDRFYAALSTLSNQDLIEMKEEEHGCEVVCQFCNKIYRFDEAALDSILEFKKSCGK